MEFNKHHKTIEASLTPLVKNPVIDINIDEESSLNYGWEITQKKYAKIDLSQWELNVKVEDSPNLAKLKELGYKEGAACRILDALGLE